MTTYQIDIRNYRLRGDHWQRWGTADSLRRARRYARALRAAFGKRYEVRRRPVGGAR